MPSDLEARKKRIHINGIFRELLIARLFVDILGRNLQNDLLDKHR